MSEPAVGIDLGTTYSALAVINPAGKPEIVANADGERVTASAVYFEENGPVHVGQLAADAAGGYPDRVVRWIKREMGNPNWQFACDGKSYTPTDISALVLKKIRQDAEQTLGPISRAVVTVPAYFDEVRRKATMDAAKRAGFEVLRIINEPTAAALAYASSGSTRGKMLIYDFGGGTFDVSVITINDEMDVSVVASEGDHRLGGHDIDRALAQYLDGRFEKEHGVTLMAAGDAVAEHQVITEAERTKRSLSSLPSRSGIPLNRGPHWMSANVTREDLEACASDLILRTRMLVEDTLSQAQLTPEQINTVLLVGGSTRIPAVQRMLDSMFPGRVSKAVNPDEAVALGAAIQAGILMQQRGLLDVRDVAAERFRNARLQDVTNHSYGTIHVGDAYGRAGLRNAVIIPKNTPIPCSRSESFCTIEDGQTAVSCIITQGEGEDPEFVNRVAEGTLELPPGRPAGREVQVTYRYDSNQRMSCEFRDVESGCAKHLDLDLATRVPRSQLSQMEVDDAALDDLIIE